MKSSDVNNAKKITLSEFKSFLTKDKHLLLILIHYGIINRDDLRKNFGECENEKLIPDCDSDIENEVSEDRWKYDNNKTDKMNDKYNKENSVKPWIEASKIAAPKDYQHNFEDAEAPDANLELDYIYGYRCEDVRNNIKYTRTGKAVYHTGAIGVVLDISETKQKHFFEHTNTISCIAMHPGLVYVATGDIGLNPLICVWDSSTMECLVRISGVLKKGVCYIAFSNDGKILAATGADDYHSIAIYAWENSKSTIKDLKGKLPDSFGLIASGQVSISNILGLVFNPSNNMIAAPEVKNIDFIYFDDKSLTVRKPISWSSKLPQTLLCAVYLGNSLITGNLNGELLICKYNTLASTFVGHQGAIYCIWVRDNLK